jgi:hypothetical protein
MARWSTVPAAEPRVDEDHLLCAIPLGMDCPGMFTHVSMTCGDQRR